MSSYTRSRFTLGAHEKATVGDTKTSVINNDHMGWLKCDGRFLSKDEWYLLFRVIGYSFGQSGELFKLPDARGMVPGIVGTGEDSNDIQRTFALGTQIGEYTHTLTIAEMPTHNHGVEGDAQPNNNQTTPYTHSHRADGAATSGGTTINAATGITINNNGEHFHTGTTDAAGWAANRAGVTGVETTQVADDDGNHTHTFTTSNAGIHNHGITDPTHNHGITADTHFHTIIPAGGDQPHNNIQPTLPIGNLFIYSGKSQYPLGGFPYTSGTTIL